MTLVSRFRQREIGNSRKSGGQVGGGTVEEKKEPNKSLGGVRHRPLMPV